MFDINISSILRGASRDLLNELKVFGMDPFERQLKIGSNRSVEFEDSIGFLRPELIPSGDIPTETACMTQGLCAGQIGIAPTERFVGFLKLLNRFPQVVSGFSKKFCSSSLCNAHRANKEG